jgi:hypothetical protein
MNGFTLPREIHSPELLDGVVYELEQYLDWYRQAKIHQKVGISPQTEPTYSNETAKVIEAWFAINKASVGSLEQLVAHLRTFKPTVVHVTLAALPNHAQRAQMLDWFRGLGGPNLMLSFVADRNIGGGVVVRTTNHMFDFSWRQRLVEGRSKMGEIVARVR